MSNSDEEPEEEAADSEESECKESEDSDKKPAAKKTKTAPKGVGSFDIEQMATNSYQHRQLRSTTSSKVKDAVDGKDKLDLDDDEYEDADSHECTSTTSATDGDSTETE